MLAQEIESGYSWGARISRRLIEQKEVLTKEAKGWDLGGVELAYSNRRFGWRSVAERETRRARDWAFPNGAVLAGRAWSSWSSSHR